nr:immunoglobulin heavy chain junction region [Homo sapiens]
SANEQPESRGHGCL